MAENEQNDKIRGRELLYLTNLPKAHKHDDVALEYSVREGQNDFCDSGIIIYANWGRGWEANPSARPVVAELLRRLAVAEKAMKEKPAREKPVDDEPATDKFLRRRSAWREQELEKTREAVIACGGSRVQAAKKLGLNLQTVMNRCKNLKDLPPSPRGKKRVKAPEALPESIPIAPVTEESELWKNRNDPEVRKQLVEKFSHIVAYHAKKIGLRLPKSFQSDDLIQSGRIGLLWAIDRFDPERGFKFSTYCVHCVRGHILHGLNAGDMLPKSIRPLIRDRRAAESNLLLQFKRPPTREEVQIYLGWTDKEYSQSLPKLVSSFDAPSKSASSDGDEQVRADTIPEMGRLDKETLLQTDDKIREMLKGLTMEETVVMYLIYWKRIKMDDIGHLFGVTKARISQIHCKAVDQLRLKGRDSMLEAVG